MITSGVRSETKVRVCAYGEGLSVQLLDAPECRGRLRSSEAVIVASYSSCSFWTEGRSGCARC